MRVQETQRRNQADRASNRRHRTTVGRRALGTGARDVDILVTHDAPDRWPVPGISGDRTLPRAWRAELPACHAGRRQLSRVLDAARPRLAVHGHLHVGYTDTVDLGGHELQVVGLACDGLDHATALVEIDDRAAAIRLLP